MTLVREYQPSFVLGDGETKEFSYLFEEVSENFVKVVVKHSNDSTYVPVFSVDLDSHKVVFGESETAPLDTDIVCIYRETPDLQDTPFRTLQGYDAKALENILSKIVAMIQELKSNGFSTQILQGSPWQLDLLHPADDGASLIVDYNARILKKGLYFQIVSGNLQVSADGNSFITMPKSADITEFRQQETVLEDLTVIYRLQYKIGNNWYNAGAYAESIANEALQTATNAYNKAVRVEQTVGGFDSRITANTNSIAAINQELDTFGNVVTHNTSEFATAAQGAKADSAIQPNDNVSELTNDATYQTQAQVNTAISAHNTSETAHQDIRAVVNGKQDTLTAGDNIDITDNVISATDTTYSAGNGLTLTGTSFSANVIDTTTSDSTINALSARIGKILQEQINNLNARGKYLSIWNCTTGLAMDEPPVDPYTYETGSFFIVGVVASAGGTNYKPSGSTYSSSIPSTTVETELVKPNDTYYYDGTTWRLLATQGGGTVAFSSILGSPYDNTNLSNALGAKANSADLATVATTGSYNDLSNKPTIPDAQVPADWNATTGVSRILNKPTIPTVPTNVSEFTNDSNYQTGTQVNSAISTHNSSTSAHSDIRSAVASKSTVSVSATGTATDEVQYITIDGVQKKLAGGSGSGNSAHNVGDIFYTMRNDNELNGAVECDGATYSTTDYSGSGAIGALLTAGKIDYISLSAYATAISTKGWCDKIGWNGTGTTAFRVPTLTPHIIQKNNIPVIGTDMSLGLTDGTENLGLFTASATNGDTFARPGLYGVPVGTSPSGTVQQANAAIGVTTDPTKSGMIADTTDTAQLRVMIQLANGATDEALETCTGVLADVAALKYDYVVDFQAPTAQNNYTWYRKYKSGWVEQGGCVNTGSDASYTVSLPIAMADTNYVIFVSRVADSSYSANINAGWAKTYNKTTTSFGTWGKYSNYPIIHWQVSGMSAS